MPVFLLTLGFMACLMLIMAVGVIFSNKALQGSCGGVGNCACEKSGRPKACERRDPAQDEALERVKSALQQND